MRLNWKPLTSAGVPHPRGNPVDGDHEGFVEHIIG
jgi:hypothetical protein